MNANVRDPAIQDVSGSTFDRLVLEAAGPVVVEFMSYGCGHCRTLEPVLEGVATSLGMTELFFRVNVAVDDELANRYAIAATPTLVFFREGREIGFGVRPFQRILDAGYVVLADIRPLLGCESCGTQNGFARALKPFVDLIKTLRGGRKHHSPRRVQGKAAHSP